jgi:acyl carrier protein
VDANTTRPTFSDIADFVREQARLPAKRQIEPDTQFERDLGITGDDGVELLEAAQKRFKVNLRPDESSYRAIFNLRANQYLFNSEGLDLWSGGIDIVTLFTDTNPTVRALTVGELFEAIQIVPLTP